MALSGHMFYRSQFTEFRLWPLFRSVDDIRRPAVFTRPPATNVFFISQSPYLFPGSLREQIAYPIWDDRLTAGLTDDVLQRLLLEANLPDLYKTHKDSLDEPNRDWQHILSGGEQQRIQFCRLFWHHDWHKEYGDGNGFYAVLDESTSALDVDSEAYVYAP